MNVYIVMHCMVYWIYMCIIKINMFINMGGINALLNIIRKLHYIVSAVKI